MKRSKPSTKPLSSISKLEMGESSLRNRAAISLSTLVAVLAVFALSNLPANAFVVSSSAVAFFARAESPLKTLSRT